MIKTLVRANAASDGIVTVGQQFSFVVTIRNTGSTALEVVPLVDNYDTTYLGFVSANPMPDEPADDGSLKWNDLTGTSALAPNDSMVVVITFTARASTDRLPNKQTTNFAVVDGARDVFGQPVPRAEGSAPIRITDPRLNISKTVTDPASGLATVGQEVTFTIRLRNVGDTTIVIIPLYDLYEANILTYVRTSISAPQVTVSGSDGELFWSDVTTSLGDLAPGQEASFTVTFRLTQPTDGTTNVALVGDDTFDENGDRVQPVQSQAGAEVRGRAEPTPTPTNTPVPGCIVGYKVDDLHVGLPAWTIRTRPSDAVSPQYETSTDGTGYFIFMNLTPGKWTVWEVQQEGWVPVTAPQFEVTVNSGPTCVQVRFKNRQATPTPAPTRTPTATPTPEGPGGQAGEELVYLPLVTRGGRPTPTPTPTRTPTPEPPGGQGEECDIPGCPVESLVQPKGLAVHTGQNVLFIASRDNNRLLKVDPRTARVLDYASTGDEPWDVVVNENTNRVYVNNFGSDDVWVYNADTLDRIAKINVGPQPTLMDILPNIDTVAVVLHGSNRVAIIEGLTLKDTVSSGGQGAYGIAADPVNNRLFVSNRDTSNLRVLRKSGSEWGSAGITLTFDDRRVIFEVAFNPNNQKLYFVHVKPSGNWYVDVWQQQADGTLVRLQKLPVDSSGREGSSDVGGTGLEVNLATGNVFNANTKANTISVISGVTDQVVATAEAGEDPFMIAINPNTNIVFVGLRAINGFQTLLDIY